MKQNYQEYNIEQKSPQSLLSIIKAEQAKIILIQLKRIDHPEKKFSIAHTEGGALKQNLLVQIKSLNLKKK